MSNKFPSITPLYGHGMGPRLQRRQHHSRDLFEQGPSEEEYLMQTRSRFEAIKGFLDGTRADPEVHAHDLNFGTDLGADEFDRSVDNFGLYHREAVA